MASAPERADEIERKSEVTVGRLADPGLPSEIARWLENVLPELLSEGVSNRPAWKVKVIRESLTAGDRPGERMIDRAAERRRNEGWDYANCMTDLPFVGEDGQPLVADVSRENRVAVVSLPAFGGIRPDEQVREVVIDVIAELAGAPSDEHHDGNRLSGLVIPLEQQEPADGDIDIRLTTTAGSLRLLAGLVRVNRPWRLVLSMGTTMASTLGTAALALVNSSVLQVSVYMGAARLSVATVGSLAAFVGWLIFNHHLWQNGRDFPAAERKHVGLYNAATLLTVTAGVVISYVGIPDQPDG